MRKAFILFFLGLAGVCSLLLSNIELSAEIQKALAQYSNLQIRLLLLINPTIFLITAIMVGSYLGPKVNLKAPVIEGFIQKIPNTLSIFTSQIKYGFIFGFSSALIVVITILITKNYLPKELIESNKINLHPISRFLYGGITEEILMRYGFMTLFTWLPIAIFKPNISNTKWPYILGIIVSSVLFGLGHLPLAYNLVGYINAPIFLYILLGNGLVGAVCGWLFWKKGLEAAFIAHISAHLVLITFDFFIRS